MSNKHDNNKLASIYENVHAATSPASTASSDDQFAEAFELALDEMGDQALQNITNAFKLVRNPAKALHALQVAIVSQNGYRNQDMDFDDEAEDSREQGQDQN